MAQQPPTSIPPQPPSAPGSSQLGGPSIDPQQQIDQLVSQYLKKKGYDKTLQQLQEEARLMPLETYIAHLGLQQDLNISQYILFYNYNEQYPKVYLDSYRELRKWVDNSLDMYKPELIAAMYPIFVQCYLELILKGHTQAAATFMEENKSEFLLEHSDEIYRLQSVTTPDHLKENERARHNNNHAPIVFSGPPQQQVQYRSISGESPNDIISVNKKPILWGLLNEQKQLYERAAAPIDTLLDMVAPRDTVTDAMDIDEEEAANKPSKKRERKEKDSKAGAAKKKARGKEDTEDEATKPATPAVVPLPKLKEATEEAMVNDLRMRAHLSADALPSICFYTLFNTHNSLNTVNISSDSSIIAAGCADSTIKLWDLLKEGSPLSQATRRFQESDGRASKYIPKEKNDEFFELIGHSQPVYGLSFSPDNQFLLSCSADGTARLWSMATKQNLVVYRGHSFPVWSVQFSPMGYYFATASHDRTARLWTTSCHYPHRIFAGHLSDVNVVQFHPNCNYIMTGSSDKCLRFWEVNTGNCVRIFTGHIAPVHTVSISPLGRFAASAGEDKDVILWDLATSKKIAVCKGHTGIVWSTSISRESTILASGSADGTVRLWDMRMLASGDSDGESEKKSLLGVYPTKYTPVFHVGFTPRNLLLAAGPFKAPSVTTTEERT